MKIQLLTSLIFLSLCSHSILVKAAEPSQSEKQLLEEVERRRIRAGQAEATEKVVAVGIDQNDCVEQARYRASRISSAVLSRCDSDAREFYRCEIVAQRIVQYPTYISSVSGFGDYNENKTTEEACRSSAIHEAERDALSDCSEKYGVSCQITSRGTVTSHRAYERRRYFIMGPKELRHECKANAAAEPASQYRYQCAVEVVAKARL
ncbi:hypothetical protein EZJ49_12835 [Bdellovibrio bacteriovorus]|uniref:hypothetical protein n=1 Tax=Bdellovibrio bacteriovorus TaxID=959 RepID=UPI0021D03823|nr:hypothetical protein [Bdellovibrio bacteriovorus]UXR63951.1 hypothetical protein EZJ49_12835 [Bdellovibrio bacteriovorus]